MDSTSAAGWIRKSCFKETQQPAQMHMACHLARLIIGEMLPLQPMVSGR